MMLLNYMQTIILFTSIMFLIMKHPLMMGMILVIQTISLSFMLGMISQTFWMAYILFLVMIGGMLILFMYMISLIFNKMFIQKFNINKFIIMCLISLSFTYLNKSLIINNMELFPSFYTWTFESPMNLIKLYNFPMNLINMLMINYLFFLLIMVVKLTSIFYGPLRMKI